MQRNPHSYQIATGYRTFYSLSLIYQPITKKRLFFIQKRCGGGVLPFEGMLSDYRTFGADGVAQAGHEFYIPLAEPGVCGLSVDE